MKIIRICATLLFIALIASVSDQAASQPRYMPPPDPPGALYYSISPIAFALDTIGAKYSKSVFQLTLLKGSGGGSFVAPINLPQGARIWGWRAWVRDMSSSTYIGAVLEAKDHGSPGALRKLGNLKQTSNQFKKDAVVVLHDGKINYQVENAARSYFLRCNLGAPSVYLHGAVIIYTMR